MDGEMEENAFEDMFDIRNSHTYTHAIGKSLSLYDKA